MGEGGSGLDEGMVCAIPPIRIGDDCGGSDLDEGIVCAIPPIGIGDDQGCDGGLIDGIGGIGGGGTSVSRSFGVGGCSSSLIGVLFVVLYLCANTCVFKLRK